ncbi:MAG: hypothetical protein ACP5UH_01810 [Candidatus Micrarchaeia archaeon]
MLCVGDQRISLDRRESGSTLDFVSHAHSDHIGAAKRSSNIIASMQTIDILDVLGIHANHASPHGGIELLPAGHILGSRQLYAHDGNSGFCYLYSGDFQMQRSMAAESIVTKNADVLIIDSTYPSPAVSFGIKEEVITEIQDWTEKALRKGSVLFSAYATGKAQELVAIMNDIGIVPVVTKKISAISSVYNRYNAGLTYVSAYDGEGYEEVLGGDFVGISEQRSISELGSKLEAVHHRRFYTAMVTGFASFMHFGTDAQFSLSDHADFAQSIDYINEVNPEFLLTYGQNADRFAVNLNKFGYNARPFRNGAMPLPETIIAKGNKAKTYIY